MGQALYRKYRSKSFDEVVGQDHVTATLSNAIKSGNISHAYLFTGPRGVGKTSVARILAHIVNGVDYKDESTHLDIIEIDAASNRRIDEIRELRQRVHSAPTSAKYKVYIIDEVHMLTREAFNALLKTLEEPPEHVIFILATTEAHKLPETIISRTQRFSFKPIDKEKVVEHLKAIAKTEKITVEDSALELIAEHGGGSFRDSIGLLDQVRGLGKQITADDVQKLLGIPPATAAEELLADMKSGSKKQLLERLNGLSEQGFLANQIAKKLASVIRASLIDNQPVVDSALSAALLRQLLEVPSSHDPASLLEIILLTAPVQVTNDALVEKPTISAPEPKIQTEKPAVAEPETAKKPAAQQTIKKSGQSGELNDELWQDTLQALKQQYNTLYSLVRMASPRYEAGKLTLIFGFSFHQKRLNETKNKQIVTDIVNNLAGSPITIVCELNTDNQQASPPKQPVPAAPITHLDTISNIFGGGEMLES